MKTFKEIAEEMVVLQAKKNKDYGNAFGKSLDKYGPVVSLIRLGDKMNRLEAILGKERSIKEETAEDTLIDLAAYALMTVEWLNKWENKKSENSL